MVPARECLCPATARRTGHGGMDRLAEGNTAQLDWTLRGCRNAIQRERQRPAVYHLHHQGRHHLWCDLHGACPRKRTGGAAHHRRATCRRGRIPGLCEEAHRARTHQRPQGDGRVLRLLCHQPVYRRGDSRVDFRICAGRIWHRGHHGRACPRLARLCLCQAFRPAHRAAHRGMRRERGEL